DGQMEFTPSSSFAFTMGAHLPFSFAKDLQACGIDQKMAGAFNDGRRQSRIQAGLAAAQSRVIRHCQGTAQQPQQGNEQTLSGSQRQVVKQAQRQQALHRQVRVNARPPATASSSGKHPLQQNTLIKPEFYVTALDKALVVVWPVTHSIPYRCLVHA